MNELDKCERRRLEDPNPRFCVAAIEARKSELFEDHEEVFKAMIAVLNDDPVRFADLLINMNIVGFYGAFKDEVASVLYNQAEKEITGG